MDAQSLELDYFVFYETQRDSIDEKIGLQCQFDEDIERCRVGRRRRFGDRVSKNKQPLFDKGSSLTWYDLHDQDPDPIRTIVYEDQWGEHKIQIGSVVGILTPSLCGGLKRKFADRLDHFKVFEVVYPETKPPPPIELDGDFQNGPETLSVQAYFAAPANKEHGRKEYRIINDQAHLVVYGLAPKPREPVWVPTRDQFGRSKTGLHTPHLFGAPCIKRHWEIA